MPTQDTSKIKEDILLILKIRGPSLPVHIAQESRLSPLFTSAFLSELFSEKRVKMSNLRVGSSPVYFLSGQEQELEKFSHYLKSKEREAFLLLREKKILKEEEQEPAIKVALRAIKDFAIPFEKNKELCWRYFITSETEIETSPRIEKIKEPEEIEDTEIEKPELKIESTKVKKIQKKKSVKKIGKSKKSNDKFLAKVKDFLSNGNIEIIGIESFSKEGLVLKVKINGEEKAFIAYNKKKITEKDLINANKKAEELGLKYIILSLDEPSKKTKELIGAVKNLSGIEKIE